MTDAEILTKLAPRYSWTWVDPDWMKDGVVQNPLGATTFNRGQCVELLQAESSCVYGIYPYPANGNNGADILSRETNATPWDISNDSFQHAVCLFICGLIDRGL